MTGDRWPELTAGIIRAAFPEWEFTLSGDGWWHARLTSDPGGTVVTDRTLIGLAEKINDLIAGPGGAQ